MLHPDLFRPDVAALYPLIQEIAAQEVRSFAHRRIEADDLAQDCAYRLLQGLPESVRARLEGPEVGSWLRRLMRNRILQQATSQANRSTASPNGRRGPFSREAEPASEAPPPEDFRKLHAAVAGLLPPELDATVVLLAFDQQIAEVARLRAVPPAVVRGQAQHAGALIGSVLGRMPPVAARHRIGPLTLAEFLVEGQQQGRSLVELAFVAGIRCSTARSLVRRAKAGPQRRNRGFLGFCATRPRREPAIEIAGEKPRADSVEAAVNPVAGAFGRGWPKVRPRSNVPVAPRAG